MEKSMTFREQIEVMKAASAGAVIETTSDGINWAIEQYPIWGWEDSDYRVAHDIDYKIRVMEAFLSGAVIETIELDAFHASWEESDDLTWDWGYRDYRIQK